MNPPAGGDQTQPANRTSRRIAQLVIEDDADPLATLGEVEYALGAPIAVLFQQQALHA